jgi:hypothetical protein
MVYIECWSENQQFSIKLIDSKGKSLAGGKSIIGSNLNLLTSNGQVIPDINSYYIIQNIKAGVYKVKITNTSKKSDLLNLTACSFKGVGKLKQNDMMFAGISKEKTIDFEVTLDSFAFIIVRAYNYRNNKDIIDCGLANVTISDAYGNKYKINTENELGTNYEGLPCEPGTYKVSIDVKGANTIYYCCSCREDYSHYYFIHGGNSVDQSRNMIEYSFIYKKKSNTTYNAEVYFRYDETNEKQQWFIVKPSKGTKYYNISSDSKLGGITVNIYDKNMNLLQTYITDKNEIGNLLLPAQKTYYISIKKNLNSGYGYATISLYSDIMVDCP